MMFINQDMALAQAKAGKVRIIGVASLQQHIKLAFDDKDLRTKLEANGFVPEASAPDVCQKFVSDEIDKWSKVVKDAGAKVD